MQKETLTNTGAIGSIAGIAACPLCVPFFTSLFSSLGLGAIIPFWQPVIGVFFFVALYGFISAFRIHQQILPLVLLIIGGVLLYVGRYIVGSDPFWIIGAVTMIAAVVTNHRAGKNLHCKK